MIHGETIYFHVCLFYHLYKEIKNIKEVRINTIKID